MYRALDNTERFTWQDSRRHPKLVERRFCHPDKPVEILKSGNQSVENRRGSVLGYKTAADFAEINQMSPLGPLGTPFAIVHSS
jgi:hypothetical protein